MFQRFAGLPETGQLDQATLYQMSKSRCGVADFGKTDNMRRKKRYTLQGTYWKKKVMHTGYPVLRENKKTIYKRWFLLGCFSLRFSVENSDLDF